MGWCWMESDLLAIESADVYQRERRVGTLRREGNDTTFAYLPEVAEGESGIAFHLPTETREYRQGGGALHPFFAGLLPEGARLTALSRGLKTSLDDMFTLLLAVGGDCIGDVVVVPADTQPEPSPSLALGDPASLDFAALFAKSISDGDEYDRTALPGVQDKVSASMVSFPVGGSSSILKLNPPQLPCLVENECFFLRMFKDLGVVVNKASLVYDRNGASGLLVERFDRYRTGRSSSLEKTHQEDACQFTNVFPAAKYRLTMKDIAEAVVAHASIPPLAIREFLRISAANYLVANGDFHGKNLSLYRSPKTGMIEITPAYDVLTTLPYGDDRMALKMDGKDKNLKRRAFVEFGGRYGVASKAVERLLDKICDASPPWIERLEEIGFSPKKTQHVRGEILRRREDLG